MAEWKAKLMELYYGLNPRDQQVVNWGAPVILLLILYLLIGRPLLDSYLNVVDTHDQMRSDLVWLAEQGEYLTRVNSSCSLAIDPVAATDVEFIVTGQARRLGLEPRVTAVGNNYNLQLSAGTGNAVLSLVRELACRGLAVTLLEINLNASESTLVDAKMEFRLL